MSKFHRKNTEVFQRLFVLPLKKLFFLWGSERYVFLNYTHIVHKDHPNSWSTSD